MNKKNIFIKIILVLLFSLFSLNYVIKADSGWDSDYDSGWDSGSDWGSDSDWGSSSYDGSYSGSSEGGGFITLIFIVIIIIVIASEIKKQGMSSANRISIPQNYRILNQKALEKISKELPEFNNEEFCNSVLDTYLKVQNAWTNFDYDTLRDLLTDELYNTYHMQLKALQAKKQVNQMTDFTHLETLLTGFEKNKDGTYTFKCVMLIAFYDYVETVKGNLLRGNKQHMIEMLYEMTFVGSLDAKDNKCPNCNAPLDDSASNVCPYCRSVVVSNNHKLVMSKKQAIKQGWYK